MTYSRHSYQQPLHIVLVAAASAVVVVVVVVVLVVAAAAAAAAAVVGREGRGGGVRVRIVLVGKVGVVVLGAPYGRVCFQRPLHIVAAVLAAISGKIRQRQLPETWARRLVSVLAAGVVE